MDEIIFTMWKDREDRDSKKRALYQLLDNLYQGKERFGREPVILATSQPGSENLMMGVLR